MRTCTKCGFTKSLEEFPKSSSGKFGREARCKVCKNKASRARTASRPKTPRPETGRKYCPGCERSLEVSEFGRCSSSRDGLQVYCSECRRDRWNRERELNRYRRLEVRALKADIREVKRSLGLLAPRTDRQRLRSVFSQMQQRCHNPNNDFYQYYGSRGIELRFDDFESFYLWSFENGYRRGLEIDRIDNDGHYEPSNCRWVTHKENMSNTRRARRLTAFGETKSLLEWVEDPRCNVTLKQLESRYYNDWSNEDKLTQPAN